MAYWATRSLCQRQCDWPAQMSAKLTLWPAARMHSTPEHVGPRRASYRKNQVGAETADYGMVVCASASVRDPVQTEEALSNVRSGKITSC